MTEAKTVTRCHRCGDKAPAFAHTDADNNALQLYLVGNSAVIRLHKATGEGATIALSAKKLDALRGALGIIDAAEVIATLDAEYAEQERDESDTWAQAMQPEQPPTNPIAQACAAHPDIPRWAALVRVLSERNVRKPQAEAMRLCAAAGVDPHGVPSDEITRQVGMFGEVST